MSVEWSAEFEAILRAHLPLAQGGDIAPTARLLDLGLDSLATVSLVVELEVELGLDLPDEILVPATFETAGNLWHAVKGLV